MTMQTYDDDFVLPSFLTRKPPASDHVEDVPCNAIKARASDLRGAVGRFLHSMSIKLFRPSLRAFAAGDFTVRNGQDKMTGNYPNAPRARGAGNPLLRDTTQQDSEQDATAGAAQRPRSLVDDVATAVDRLRRIEGERGLCSLLEVLLQNSRMVLAEHGVLQPNSESAELKSLHSQVDRLSESREILSRYAKHFQEALTEIANLPDDRSDEASGMARRALTGTQQLNVQ